MSIIESWTFNDIDGIAVKTETYYVIRSKETHEFDCRDGELTEDIMQANWYKYYKEVKSGLECFDDPQDFEIIRFSCTTKLEEIMNG